MLATLRRTGMSRMMHPSARHPELWLSRPPTAWKYTALPNAWRRSSSVWSAVLMTPPSCGRQHHIAIAGVVEHLAYGVVPFREPGAHRLEGRRRGFDHHGRAIALDH